MIMQTTVSSCDHAHQPDSPARACTSPTSNAGLATSGDRDPADVAQTLRAQQHTIQALAITPSQHNEKLDRHEASLAAAHGKLGRIIEILGRLADNGQRYRPRLS
jgi:hypothetical protein